MHILYLHQYFTSHEGDYSIRSYEFAKWLIREGHQVTMLTSPAFLPTKYHSKNTRTVSIDGIPTIIIPVPWSNAMGYVQRIWVISRFALLAAWHATRTKADVVYVSSPPITIAIAGIAARLRWRIPMVFEVRDLWPEVPRAIGALKNPLLRWLAEKFTQLVYRTSSHVIALSPSAADVIEKRGVPRHKITVIPNCSDIELFDIPAEEGNTIRESLGLNSDERLVVYAGALGLTHGVEYIIDLAAHVRESAPQLRFLIIGKGKYRDRIAEKASELGLLNQSIWVWDPLPKSQIPRVFAAADVVISTTIPLKVMEHNSANKFFDGLAAGKPLAINYGGWQADLLKETGAGIVMEPGDPQRGAQQLSEFLSHPERLQNAAKAASAIAKTRFDRDQMAQELERVLIRVTQHGR